MYNAQSAVNLNS